MAEKKEVKGDIKKETNEGIKEETKPKKSFLKFIILGVIVIVLGAGGYLGWDLFKKRNQGETETSESSPKKKKQKKNEVEGGIIFPLESFIVNLMDKAGAGRRYLKVGMELEIGDKEDETLLKMRIPQLKDTILLLLSSQTFSDINSMEGKIQLKQTLLSRINQELGEGIVRKIYFTEFVVQ